jgi:hypothetical protein
VLRTLSPRVLRSASPVAVADGAAAPSARLLRILGVGGGGAARLLCEGGLEIPL